MFGSKPLCEFVLENRSPAPLSTIIFTAIYLTSSSGTMLALVSRVGLLSILSSDRSEDFKLQLMP